MLHQHPLVVGADVPPKLTDGEVGRVAPCVWCLAGSPWQRLQNTRDISCTAFECLKPLSPDALGDRGSALRAKHLLTFVKNCHAALLFVVMNTHTALTPGIP